MAGDVKVAVVHGQISSDGVGTADFTKAGFGTVKACIVLLTFDPTDNASVLAQSRASIGFSDFTLHRCISHQDESGSAKVDCDARKSNTKTYVLLDTGGSVVIDGTASAITDGVRLTNTTHLSASAQFATVIMFGGADLQVSLDTVSLDSGTEGTTVVTTGIPQDLVFFIGVDVTGEDSTAVDVQNSFGVADISDDQATIVNRCMGWASDHNNADGSPASILRNDRCLKILTPQGGDDWGVELTAATTTSYTVTTKDVGPGNGMEIYALALDLDDRKSKIGTADSPLSGATWAPSVSLGFTPQYVGLGLTHLASENVISTTTLAGGHGISSNTGPGEESCHSWYNENNAATTGTDTLFRSRVIDLRNDDTTVVVQDHSHLSFDVGGWTYTINVENETTVKKYLFWAIEEPPAGGTSFTEVSTEAVGIADDTTPVKAATQALTEPVGVGDVTTRVIVGKRTPTEAVGIGDLISTVKDITPAISEAVGLSDTIAAIKAITSSISDDVGVTDDTTAAKTAKQTPTDPTGIVDSTTRVVDAKRTPTEPVGLSDVVTSAKTIRITITEAVGLADVVDDKLTIAVDIAEAIGVADSTTRVHIAKRTPVEAVGVGDVIAAVKTITPAITEALELGDEITRIVTALRSVTEPVGVTDLIAAAKTITPAVVEAIALTDSTSAAKSITQSISEAVGVTDPVTAVKTIKITISEAVGVTELVVDVLGANDVEITIPEAVGIADTTVRVHGAKRTPIEAAGVTDTTSRVLDAKRTVDEAVGLADTVLPAKSIIIVISEAVGVTDVITPAKTITTTVTESVGVADFTSRIATFVRSVTEALGMGDTTTSAKTVRRSIDDPVGLLDVVADVLTGAPSQTPITRIVPHQGVTVRTIPHQGRTEGVELE